MAIPEEIFRGETKKQLKPQQTPKEMRAGRGGAEPMDKNRGKDKNLFYNQWWFWVIIVVAAGFIGAISILSKN